MVARNGYYPIVRITVELGEEDSLKQIRLMYEYEAKDKDAVKYFFMNLLNGWVRLIKIQRKLQRILEQICQNQKIIF